MVVEVGRELQALHKLNVAELRVKYAEVWGEETRSRNKPHLIKRIIWRLQALEQGGLSDRARARARELADESHLRARPPKDLLAGIEAPAAERTEVSSFDAGDRRLPPPGSIIQREYRGQAVTVVVLPKGFQYDGERYRSLTAITKAVTGSHWNGYAFFGLDRRRQ